MTTRPSAVSEQTGLFLTAGFVLCGALRDVYFSRAFQAWSPLDVAALTFAISTTLFLVIALASGVRHLGVLAQWPRDIVAINVTSATAWIAFFYALQNLEPALVQVMWAGSGPLTIRALERLGAELVEPVRLAAFERWCLAAIGLMVTLAGAVALLGLSATDPRSAALGVGLTLLSGAAISINILLCKRLHVRGVAPAPLLSVRFIGVAVIALALAPFVRTGPSLWSSPAFSTVAGVALLLIVLPLYLNQRGLALASPMTVRIVHAAGPVLVFAIQLVEARLPASPWSLAVIVGYSGSAVLSATARQWQIAAEARLEKLTAPSQRTAQREGSV